MASRMDVLPDPIGPSMRNIVRSPRLVKSTTWVFANGPNAVIVRVIGRISEPPRGAT